MTSLLGYRQAVKGTGFDASIPWFESVAPAIPHTTLLRQTISLLNYTLRWSKLCCGRGGIGRRTRFGVSLTRGVSSSLMTAPLFRYHGPNYHCWSYRQWALAFDARKFPGFESGSPATTALLRQTISLLNYTLFARVKALPAVVAELVDAPDLGSGAGGVSSSLSDRTIISL